MDLKDILAVSGQRGLCRMISQGNQALIVEQLETGKRMPVYASHKVNTLEEITIFTTGDDLPLKEVLLRIYEKESGKELKEPKNLDNNALRAYFSEVVPEHNPLRVYLSDIRKILTWYNLLLRHGQLEWSGPEKADETEEKKD